MICVASDTNGAVYVVNPQPADVSTCTAVLATPSEVVSPLWGLTLDDGATIAGAIVAVWAVGFAFRAVISTLHEGTQNEQDQ